VVDFFIKYKNAIYKAFKIFGPITVCIVGLYVLQWFGVWAMLGCLFAIGILSLSIYMYLDLQESLKDESFRNIYENMNKIEKTFGNDLSFNQYPFIHDEDLMVNPYFKFSEDFNEQNYFYGDNKKTNYHFYMVKDENMSGMVLDVEFKNTENSSYIYYFTGKTYEIDMNLAKEYGLRKIGETSKLNVYTTNSKKTLPSTEIMTRLDLMIPDGGKRLRFFILKENKILYYIDKLSPYTFKESEDMDKKKIRDLICSEILFFKNQLEKMTEILICKENQ